MKTRDNLEAQLRDESESTLPCHFSRSAPFSLRGRLSNPSQQRWQLQSSYLCWTQLIPKAHVFDGSNRSMFAEFTAHAVWWHRLCLSGLTLFSVEYSKACHPVELLATKSCILSEWSPNIREIWWIWWASVFLQCSENQSAIKSLLVLISLLFTWDLLLLHFCIVNSSLIGRRGYRTGRGHE